MSVQYRKLHDHFKRISHFEHFNNLGEWDLCTMMPDGGSEGRSEAMATLSAYLHEMRTENWLADSIEQAMQAPLAPEQHANLVEMQRQISQASLVPAELVAAKTKAAFACEHAWREQRKNNDWQGFAPNLTQVIELAREEAQIRAEALGVSAYDALLEKFEPGMTTNKLEKLFAPLRSELPGLIQQVLDKQAGEPQTSLTGKFDTAAQEALSRKVMALLDFDFKQGRLDVSSHPFSCGVPGDIRITTRFDEDDFSSSLMSTIHETGHARYEQGLPAHWQGQPAGMARSMGMHESQSLFYEMQLARSEGFLGLIRNDINQAFGSDYSLQQLKHSFTRVNRGLIRVDADEVTYPCHILLRFDAEKALIDGALAVKDLPEFWNANMQQLLGLDTQGNDKDGCMQDIHWTLGELGYFPSYTLGAMTAAQIRYAMEKQLGSLDTLMSTGRIKEIFNWLSTNIWSKGSLMNTDELMTNATGETLKGEYLLTHLKQRYL